MCHGITVSIEKKSEEREMLNNRYCVLLLMAAMLLVPTSCSVIDEDLSDCGVDNKIVYRLQLVTNVQTELAEHLSTEAEQPVASALKASLGNIFTEKAHDIDLSFYNTDDQRERHEQHIMDASSAEYVVYLPERDYRNLSVANISDAANVTLVSPEYGHRGMVLEQMVADTIDSHTTGMFTARKIIQVCKCTESYDVDLYMANCCTALVVDTAGVYVKGVNVVAQDFASRFAVGDSIYSFDNDVVIRSNEISIPKTLHRTCHYVVSFPSADKTRADAGAYYRIKAYVTLADGTITENVMTVETPLSAGNLKIIKMRMKADGSLTPECHDVGVSVTLDWKQGGVYEPDI